MSQSKPRTYSVNVKEEVTVSDKNHTLKYWFNGAKHFFTVKVLPAKRK